MVQSSDSEALYSGKILGALLAIETEMSQVGIGKDRTNQAQKFKFRGIDDVLNALAPLWAKNGVLVVPQLLSREQTERKSKEGGTLFDVVVKMRYDFVAVADGSYLTVEMPGEAMDSGDKATNKAISTAYKYAVIQLLSIPIEGSPEERDADFTTHEVAGEPRPARERPQAERKQSDRPVTQPKLRETAEPETLPDAIERLASSDPAKIDKLHSLLTTTFGVVTLDQIPADKVQDAIQSIEQFVAAQRKRAAARK